MPHSLLAADEPAPETIRNPDGRSAIVLSCDHAGSRVPKSLGRLGLPESEFDRHIAWDIGAAALSRLIADALDAPLVEQGYSRLVIDCNRPPGVGSSIPLVSEATPVPGNGALAAEAAAARRAEIFDPYHAALAALLDRRRSEGRMTALVAMHSFTPVYLGDARFWHIGTLYGRDGRLAQALFRLLAREGDWTVGDNQPYAVSAETDHTIPVHGEARGLVHVGIEIRQDLVADAAGQAQWAEILTRLLPEAVAEVG